LGDVASGFVERVDGPSQTERDDAANTSKAPAPAAAVVFTEVADEQLRTPKAFASGLPSRMQSTSNFITALAEFQGAQTASAPASETVISPLTPRGAQAITVSLPIASFDTSVPASTIIIQPVMTTLIDPTTTNGIN